MTRRLCATPAIMAVCAGHRLFVGTGGKFPPERRVMTEGVWNISILAMVVAGDPITNLSYIGVMRIGKQRLRTHVLGREDEGCVTSLTSPS